ncbi:heavy metal translocatin [Eremomyces bilateralis CBS 781.70]|uniref:Heavy metal translocatin n=1 Tax=Eremomyces bilateralis CBS 781.70 TaxID=1392243 RepID=A0A6G1G6P1_9PEZI|nr:heavy metal translocatin [Eremomyces bilateralis CBS 781.70]KAF1813708.1 heavy metal translocatin [Eremomyces bilateralis CBS 781.70]
MIKHRRGQSVPERMPAETVSCSPTSPFRSATPLKKPSPAEISVIVDPTSAAGTFKADISIVGMTCSACVGAITNAVEELPFVRTINVSLLTHSATVVFEGNDHAEQVRSTIEDAGFDATIEGLEEIGGAKKRRTLVLEGGGDVWKATYMIGGMTCAACVGNVSTVVKQLDFVNQVDINLIQNSGVVEFKGKDNVGAITEAIEDAGFDATLENMVNAAAAEQEETYRTVSFRVDGMFCHHCPTHIVDALEQEFKGKISLEKIATTADPIFEVQYAPHAPHFTIRTIFDLVASVNPEFKPTPYHAPTLEDRSRALHARERRTILLRLALCVTAGIPAFIIGIVCMSLLHHDNAVRTFMMAPMWTGTVSRSEWALFILATPVYFFGADIFHRKAIKEVKAMWRPGSKTPMWKRFVRFGSMNMLMCLGTSIAYFSSIAELIIGALEKPKHGGHDMKDMKRAVMDGSGIYFDSVIFLTMFLLMGRFLEAYSKAKTGDAVTNLGNLRPSEAILVESTNVSGRKIPVALLDVGDVVRVQAGGSPPFDGIIIDGSSRFDESSLTGESRPVQKEIGDTVYSGTVNRTGPVSMKLTTTDGSSMLDQIIKVVREGQTHRAPVERAADIITSHFVPFVILVAIVTWTVWLATGMAGLLPDSYLDNSQGGYPLWSLRFAIAVFVVACPCGIGLAAPTAMFVGGGLAAKFGILVKGGGEAFQEASDLDVVVFDKTGTLTEGGDPKVTGWKMTSDDDADEVLAMVRQVESGSGHPVAKAVMDFCEERLGIKSPSKDTDGEADKEMDISDSKPGALLDVDVLVGNERLLEEHDVGIDEHSYGILQGWKRQGRSVVLVALRAAYTTPEELRRYSRNPPQSIRSSIHSTVGTGTYILTSLFAISDPLRDEAPGIVSALTKRGIEVWMLSGDNPTTAQAVAAQVGIKPTNVIAGVLPEQKAEKIKWLQKTVPARKKNKKKQRSQRKRSNESTDAEESYPAGRATVAMVGDGINDSPALTMADVGIAIGSGSDIAISSADFILIHSKLSSVLTLIDLSRKVFRRVWFNFGWACVYNLIAMPVAAGVLYPVESNGAHVRLDPVWASLAMACSSLSVVGSSLALRSRLPGLGFRYKK